MWTCPKCATKVDPSFEVCWNCGTTPDGVEDPTFVSADAAPPVESPLDLDMPEGDTPIPDAPSEPGGELVECYWALDLMQAKFLADRLTGEGFYAVADTQDLLDQLGLQGSRPRVWVRQVDLERAKAWLEEFDRKNQQEHSTED